MGERKSLSGDEAEVILRRHGLDPETVGETWAADRGFTVEQANGFGPAGPPYHVRLLDAAGDVVGDGWADSTSRDAFLAAIVDHLER